MRYNLLLLTVASLLSGCAMGSGVLPAGPDTYSISEHYAPLRGGSTAAFQAGMNEGNAFCVQQGRAFLPINTDTPSSANIYGNTDFRMTFRCLLPGDPDLGRSVRAPDAVIQQRTP
jgi:hypothetical protein